MTQKKNLARYLSPDAYKWLYFQKGRDTVAVDINRVKDKYGVHSVIKLRKKDFKCIGKRTRQITHFNIQYCGHKKGKEYLILKIEVPGYFDGKTEKPPIFNRKNFLTCRCLSVKNNISYEDLAPADFKYSFEHIAGVASLKKAILRRYRESLAHLSNREKLSLGVSITQLQIRERFSRDLIKTL